jgi:hypothetical protein
MTPGATATTTDRRSAHTEYSVYESRTPATTTITTARRVVPADAPPASDPLRAIPSLVPLGEALRALVGLQPNWDSYGAEPPSGSALEYAWSVGSTLVEQGVPIPQVFPTPAGGVQLEWHLERGSLEWEIDPGATSGVFAFDDHLAGERIDGELPEDIDPLADALSRILGG